VKSSLKIGVIGAGRIGKVHAENLSRMPEAEIKAIADLYADDQLREWAGRLGVSEVVQDCRQVLNDAEIDAVFICSSTDTHVPFIIEAARAGKHIFCEKPISFQAGLTGKALDEVRRAGVKLQVGFNRRFDHNFRRVRELVSEGKVGTPHLIKITSRDPSPPSPEYIKVSGGLFLDMAIHDFDMARYLSGSEVEEVSAQGAVLIDPAIGELGDIDTAVITLKFASGALGVIDNSRQAVFGYDQRVEVFGSAGLVQADNDFPNNVLLSTSQGIYRDKQKLFFMDRYDESYRREAESFIESVLYDRPVAVDGSDAQKAELIAHAARKSLELGRPVKMAEIHALGAV
jgi:myo-inositol 2-dehydrogenase/D-chiro-inositol 1-dehydrogenase